MPTQPSRQIHAQSTCAQAFPRHWRTDKGAHFSKWSIHRLTSRTYLMTKLARLWRTCLQAIDDKLGQLKPQLQLVVAESAVRNLWRSTAIRAAVSSTEDISLSRRKLKTPLIPCMQLFPRDVRMEHDSLRLLADTILASHRRELQTDWWLSGSGREGQERKRERLT